ncbi:MAG TPA: hypothetical protein DHW36_02700 [Thalassospira sp.]|nr:hypothetical protein [Thalassospira sp.]
MITRYPIYQQRTNRQSWLCTLLRQPAIFGGDVRSIHITDAKRNKQKVRVARQLHPSEIRFGHFPDQSPAGL